MHAAVPRVAIFGLLLAEGQLLPVADGDDPIARDAVGEKVLLHRGGATGAERQVVLDGAPLVAVAFELYLGPGIGLQPGDVLVGDALCFAVEIGGVVAEAHVAEDAVFFGRQPLSRACHATAGRAGFGQALCGSVEGAVVERRRTLLLAAAAHRHRQAQRHHHPTDTKTPHALSFDNRRVNRAAATTRATYHPPDQRSILAACVLRDR